jgi:N-acetylmuramoyl-L-alanine amidase
MKKFQIFTLEDFLKNFPVITQKLTRCTIHVSDSPVNRGDKAEEIERWHIQRGFKERGFKEIGYHLVILPNGNIQIGRNINKVGAHVGGFNTGNLGICLIGGFKGKDERTNEQKKTLAFLIAELIDRKILTQNQFFGHNDLDRGKTCPNFIVKNFVTKEIGNYIF